MQESWRSKGPQAWSRQPPTESSPLVSLLKNAFIFTPARHASSYGLRLQTSDRLQHTLSESPGIALAPKAGVEACKRGSFVRSKTLRQHRWRAETCNMMDEVYKAENINFILLRPHPAIKPFSKLKHQVIHISLHRDWPISVWRH